MSTDPNTTDSGAPDTAPQDALAAAEAKIAQLEQELADARERADRYHSNWQRSAADFQNWKRRTDQEKADLSKQAEGAMALELLRVIDDFERAFQVLPSDFRTFTWIEGVYMIGQKLFALMQARGLAPIDALGQEFDPYHHEAVLRDEGAEGSDTLVVVQELQRGYTFQERVLRPTMVKVGPPAAATASAPNGEPADPNGEPAEGGETSGTDDAPVAS
ncbi:MAG: nucleotide exchange factor GrpE [Chloroflexi bacterium]|nr:nucleotide exchange factor GrpE [Chloroflexota bacterium]